MIFGDHVEAAATTEPGAWIDGARRSGWSVGSLVPTHYPVVLRVHAPDPDVEDWWAAYRAVWEAVASVGAAHTSTPRQAWFAVWEGHGWADMTTHVASRTPLEGPARVALEKERARLRDEHARRNAAIRAELGSLPHLALPDRTYLLLSGPVEAATRLRCPGGMFDWQRPDLCWPDDQRWFVATDVDFWSLYVGCGDDLAVALAERVPTTAEIVSYDDALVRED